MKDLPHGPLWVGWMFIFSLLAWIDGQLLEPLIAVLIGAALFYGWHWAWSKRPRYLRADLYNSVRMAPGVQVPKVRPWFGVVCRHRGSVRAYTRTDSTEGSGWMSDSYDGTVCMDCGRILFEKKVY